MLKQWILIFVRTPTYHFYQKNPLVKQLKWILSIGQNINWMWIMNLNVNHEGFLKLIFTGFYQNDLMCHIQASHSGPPFLHAIRAQFLWHSRPSFLFKLVNDGLIWFGLFKNDSQEITVFWCLTKGVTLTYFLYRSIWKMQSRWIFSCWCIIGGHLQTLCPSPHLRHRSPAITQNQKMVFGIHKFIRHGNLDKQLK
jgi:hypothetical protein